MSHQHVKYLLVGGGLASSSAAHAIREIDPVGSLLLIGQESTRPYARPPLSKEFLRGQKPREELFTDYVGFFSGHDVELHTGLRAVHLDPNRRLVSFDNGDEIAFDKLLIATGASPRHLAIPGAQLPNVHYLRNFADADRLHHAVEKAKREGRPHPGGRGHATVIGSGLLAPEVAATLTHLGLSVDLVVGGPHPWKKYAGEATGRFLTRYLEKNGVGVHLNADPTRLEGDGRVQRVVLSSGPTLPCDFVVPAIGVAANKELLRGTAIAAEKAILVDDHCRASLPDIYAAGDVAAVFDPLFGKHRQIDHWDNAIASGTVAGKNMAGADVRYDAVSTFNSEIFGLRIDVWGAARLVDRRILRGAPADNGGFVEIGVAADGRVAQVLAVNHSADAETFRELVRRRLNVTGKEEQLKDPASNLTETLN